MDSVYSKFAHYEQPINDFERARQQISTPFDYYDLDLSIARTNEVLPISGDFLYVDLVSTGTATLELNNQHEAKKAPFLVQKGFALQATFKQLKISNSAQSGGLLRIMYSTGDRVIPATGQTQVSGTVNTIEAGIDYGASYKSNTTLGAAGVETVFTPGANVNGAIIYQLAFWSNNATGHNLGVFLVKNGVPASFSDGDLVLQPTGSAIIAGNYSTFGNSLKTFNVPAGKGLYFYNPVAEAQALRSALYKFL